MNIPGDNQKCFTCKHKLVPHRKSPCHMCIHAPRQDMYEKEAEGK